MCVCWGGRLDLGAILEESHLTPQLYRPDIVHKLERVFGEVIIGGNASKLRHFFPLESSHGEHLASTL